MTWFMPALSSAAMVYGYDNSYILDPARKYPGRFHPVVILDTQDPRTPALYRNMVRNDRVAGFRMANSRPWILDTAWMSSPIAMEIWQACADLGTPMTLIVFRQSALLCLAAHQDDSATVPGPADHPRSWRNALWHVAI